MGLTGPTTVNASAAAPANSAPARSPVLSPAAAAAAGADGDSDDGLEFAGEQSLDEVLEASAVLVLLFEGLW